MSASGFVLFSKDFVEASLASAAIAAGHDPTEAPYNYIIAGLAGVWYGLFHQTVDKFNAGLLNAPLNLTRYTPDGTEGERQYQEFCTKSLFHILFYTSLHAARGSLTEGVSGPWTLFACKLATSCIAGGLVGFFGDVVSQTMAEGFKATPPAETVCKNIKMQLESAFVTNRNLRRIFHDFVGKTLGATAGMLAAVPLAPQDLPGATSFAGEGALQSLLAKLIFELTFVLFGIHALSAIGRAMDLALAPSESVARTNLPPNAGDATSLERESDQDSDISTSDVLICSSDITVHSEEETGSALVQTESSAGKSSDLYEQTRSSSEEEIYEPADESFVSASEQKDSDELEPADYALDEA